VSPRYAKEKQTAYAKRKNAEGQLPRINIDRFDLPGVLLLTRRLMTIKAAAPDTSLTAVKPAASASPPLNANRHNIELNANATSAKAV
jgi:hypothetical protein